MPKQIHEIIYTLWLNDMKFTACGRWSYSDPTNFVWEGKEFKTFDAVWDWMNNNSIFHSIYHGVYTDYTLFKKRKQIVTYNGNVSARNFESASITAKVNIIKEPNVRELMNELSAREFAQFMSDNIGKVLANNVEQEN